MLKKATECIGRMIRFGQMILKNEYIKEKYL
jgi:hypothetical protein